LEGVECAAAENLGTAAKRMPENGDFALWFDPPDRALDGGVRGLRLWLLPPDRSGMGGKRKEWEASLANAEGRAVRLAGRRRETAVLS